MKIETASEQEITAVFYVCCLFRSDKAHKREKWFTIINELLPLLAPTKKYVMVDYENYWRSSELWSLKYVCYLIEKCGKPTSFAETYFDKSMERCFKWLNDFLSFVFELQEDSREVILKKKIIPTQLDEFKAYDDFIFAEQDSRYFDKTIKDIYKVHVPKNGDPRRFIIDTRISFDGLRKKTVDVLTNEIDKIFQDQTIENKVKLGGTLNEMFLQLNDWFEGFSTSATLLPTFAAKRNLLYVLALGEGFSKQIMDIRSTGKTMEDLTELAKIQLTPQEMKKLETFAAELGIGKLMEKAQEMLNAKQQIERWKSIGTAAEKAFKNAIADLDCSYEIKNPDVGKDFELIINTKGYSIEIKSVADGKENVRMSLLQGSTAVLEKDSYALCVMTRANDNQVIDENYFRDHARFVTDIGYQIGDTIDLWKAGLSELVSDGDIKVQLDEKTESVYVNRPIWRNGIGFDAFLLKLKERLPISS